MFLAAPPITHIFEVTLTAMSAFILPDSSGGRKLGLSLLVRLLLLREKHRPFNLDSKAIRGKAWRDEACAL
jgi:hypothetical protein